METNDKYTAYTGALSGWAKQCRGHRVFMALPVMRLGRHSASIVAEVVGVMALFSLDSLRAWFVMFINNSQDMGLLKGHSCQRARTGGLVRAVPRNDVTTSNAHSRGPSLH